MPNDQSRQSFDDLLSAAELPGPGPDYYHARRALWLTPRVPVAPLPASSARDKLEEILSNPSAVHSDVVWNNGLEKVWKGLSSGGRLKHQLPMGLIIKIIYAAWLRDKTWPVGMEAPDSDQEQRQGQEQPQASASVTDASDSIQPQRIPNISSSEVMETTMPWTRMNPIR